MGKTLDLTPEIIIEAIEDSGSVISTIASRLDVNWHTAKKYIDMYPETKQAYLDEEETILDYCESAIHNSIKEKGDLQSAKWVLATKGKKRGYSDKHEIDLNSNITINFDREDKEL